MIQFRPLKSKLQISIPTCQTMEWTVGGMTLSGYFATQDNVAIDVQSEHVLLCF